MAKKLIKIPQGNLMRVAATKDVTTLTDLKEKTGVDRKTLRAIDAGKPVKETTIQSVANRLRVPLTHLIGPNTPDKLEDVSTSGDVYYRREIKLQRLDATALRRLAEAGKITWLLKIDHMSEELETLLMRLEKSLDGWSHHSAVMYFEPLEQIKLTEQIAAVKTSADIDRIVKEFTQKKFNIYGGTYVLWNKEVPRDPDDDYHPISPPTLNYTSRHMASLCITPEEKSTLTVCVATGWEPPQQFDESELADIDFVKVDGKKVWSRKTFGEDDIPF